MELKYDQCDESTSQAIDTISVQYYTSQSVFNYDTIDVGLAVNNDIGSDLGASSTATAVEAIIRNENEIIFCTRSLCEQHPQTQVQIDVVDTVFNIRRIDSESREFDKIEWTLDSITCENGFDYNITLGTFIIIFIFIFFGFLFVFSLNDFWLFWLHILYCWRWYWCNSSKSYSTINLLST